MEPVAPEGLDGMHCADELVQLQSHSVVSILAFKVASVTQGDQSSIWMVHQDRLIDDDPHGTAREPDRKAVDCRAVVVNQREPRSLIAGQVRLARILHIRRKLRAFESAPACLEKRE